MPTTLTTELEINRWWNTGIRDTRSFVVTISGTPLFVLKDRIYTGSFYDRIVNAIQESIESWHIEIISITDSHPNTIASFTITVLLEPNAAEPIEILFNPIYSY